MQVSRSFFLISEARQFSSMLVLIGRVSSATTFDPKYAAIIQNKDELTIPLNLSTIPSPKEFKDAIEPLSSSMPAGSEQHLRYFVCLVGEQQRLGVLNGHDLCVCMHTSAYMNSSGVYVYMYIHIVFIQIHVYVMPMYVTTPHLHLVTERRAACPAMSTFSFGVFYLMQQNFRIHSCSPDSFCLMQQNSRIHSCSPGRLKLSSDLKTTVVSHARVQIKTGTRTVLLLNASDNVKG